MEVRSLEELDDALSIDPLAERILLDNLDVAKLRTAVGQAAGRVILEASGGITLETVREIAETGVHEVSVGALTHSATALDVSLVVGAPVEARPDPENVSRTLSRLRRRLGGRVLILAHHYVGDDVVRHADIVGDSLELARAIEGHPEEMIVFCGVRFMGETAATLCRPDQRVLMPVPNAGCYLADCAGEAAVATAWRMLYAELQDVPLVPVAYVNSSLSLKALCGRYNGAVCTSGNATGVLEWALCGGRRVFFFPDRNLGTNTARRLGVSERDIVVWNESVEIDSLRSARVIVWPGACNTHQRFYTQHVERIRERYPGAHVVVHPECRPAVVAQADASGSTRELIRQVEISPPGATVAIGTEATLVSRLAGQYSNKRIINLSDVPAHCSSMREMSAQELRALLQAISQGRIDRCSLAVDAGNAQLARRALERMLRI